MNEKFKAFIEKAQADPDLRAKLPKMSKEEFVATAKEMGFEFSEEDFQPPAGEVSDPELGNVSGGGLCILFGAGWGTDSHDGNGYGCACVAYGQGGDGSITDGNCWCLVGGMGSDRQNWLDGIN